MPRAALGAVITGALFAALSGVTAAELPSRAPAATSKPDDAVARKLKAALTEAENKLGTLEPWQKKLFDEEAVPQYQRFIRDYRSAHTHSGTAASNLSVDIDLESLRDYLRFYAPKVLKRDEKDAVILLHLRSSGGDCGEKCAAAAPGLRKLAQARAMRRGFRPVWVEPSDLTSGGSAAELSGKALDNRLVELAAQRNAAGAWSLQYGRAVPDDEDAAHADEKRYRVHSMLLVRGLGDVPAGRASQGKGSEFRSEGGLELLENDEFEPSSARLLTDAFTELGARTARVSAVGASTGSAEEPAEMLVVVTGLREHAQLMQAKAKLQGVFPGASVEERRLARGKAWFALVGLPEAERSVELVQAKLSVAKPDAGEGVLWEVAR